MGVLITLVVCVSSAHFKPCMGYCSEWQRLVITCVSDKFLDSTTSYVETSEYLMSVLYKIGSLRFKKFTLLFTGLSIDDIAAQALVFFSAGFENVATLLSFTTLLLAVLQDIQKQVKDEIYEVLAEHGGQVTYEAVQRMRRLDNVVSGRKNLKIHGGF